MTCFKARSAPLRLSTFLIAHCQTAAIRAIALRGPMALRPAMAMGANLVICSQQQWFQDAAFCGINERYQCFQCTSVYEQLSKNFIEGP